MFTSSPIYTILSHIRFFPRDISAPIFLTVFVLNSIYARCVSGFEVNVLLTSKHLSERYRAFRSFALFDNHFSNYCFKNILFRSDYVAMSSDAILNK